MTQSLTAAQVWDEPIELRLPPPLPDEKPLQVSGSGASRLAGASALASSTFGQLLQQAGLQCAWGSLDLGPVFLQSLHWPSASSGRPCITAGPNPPPSSPHRFG